MSPMLESTTGSYTNEPWRRGKGDIPRFEWWSSHDLRLMYETEHSEIILKMLKEGKSSES